MLPVWAACLFLRIKRLMKSILPSRTAIKSAPSRSRTTSSPVECAETPSGVNPLIDKNIPSVFSSFLFTFAANVSSSDAAIGFDSHFASNRNSVPSNENAPSICSPVLRKEAFGSKSNSSKKSRL